MRFYKKHKRTILFLGLTLLISLLFCINLWKDVIFPTSNLRAQGESPIYEYVAERIYRNIKGGQDIFSPAIEIMYPFGWNYVLDDIAPINGFYFIFLRPVLNPHQSLVLITLISLTLSSVLMYIFLKKLRISEANSMIFGLAYGFTPFISYRIGGHPTYIALFLFPAFGLLLNSFLNSATDNKKKLKLSILLTGLVAVSILTNLYFSVMIFLVGALLILAYLINYPQITLKFFKQNFRFFIFSGVASIVLLFPWLTHVRNFLFLNSYTRPLRVEDYIPFSADVFNFILPSRFNPFYSNFMIGLNRLAPFVGNVFEDFVYPGLIILASYFLIIKYFKKIPRNILILFWTSIFFAILSLGPYLKFFGKITNIPLPYLVIRMIPFVQLARAPGRFIIPFIFLASVAGAFAMDIFTKKISAEGKKLLFIGLLTLFLIDQSFISPRATEKKLPLKLYSYMNEQSVGPTLNIPFVIRDGITNLGYPHEIWQPYSQLLHNQPIYSIYAGRLGSDIFDYYSQNYLFGLFDKVINGNLPLEALTSADLIRLERSLSFFEIKNVLIKTDERYSIAATDLFKKLNFKKTFTENEYSLYSRGDSPTNEILAANFDITGDDYVLYDGWHKREQGYRWANGKVSRAVFKLSKKRPMTLQFEAEAIVKPQGVKIYVGEKFITQITVQGGSVGVYGVDLGENLSQGFNTVVFRYASSYKIGKITGNPKDLREVSINIKSLKLREN